jgi:hypothetical protein
MAVLHPPTDLARHGEPTASISVRHEPSSRAAAPTGPILFARYAFGPNRLGLCGPEDWRSLLELGSRGDAAASATGERRPTDASEVDRGLRDLACRFEGAYPYLRLIAEANGVADPMDRRVVDAYWIGNALSDRVDPSLLHRSMTERFRPEVAERDWRWLDGKPSAGAHPTHAFHVLDIFPRVGRSRRGPIADELGLMEACRIRWGRVLEIAGEHLVVAAVPLRLVDGALSLGAPRPQTVRRWLDGTGFVSDVAVGDTVSLHWDWACEVLGPARERALRDRTLHQLGLANETL